MTQQRFHIDKQHPCPSCGSVYFFKHTRRCIPCTKRMNARKAAMTMKGMEHGWNTQACRQNTACAAFKAKESQLMQGVRYD